VTCNVGYLCANFSLDLGQMYATDVRQTDVRRQTDRPTSDSIIA